MPSYETLDFQLARLTAQSRGADPNQVKGGKPETPVEIIRLMAAHIESLPAYYAVIAKSCGDDIAVDNLCDIAISFSWREWRRNEHKRKTRISVERLNQATLAAVMMFLCPFYKTAEGETKRRDDEWAARFAQTTDKKWAKDFADHSRLIVQRLTELEASGKADMMRFARAWKENSAKCSETLDAA